MAGKELPKKARRAIYRFCGKVASLVSDTRRQRFLKEMIAGLIIGGHTHLTCIARAAGNGANKVHADEKRLSRHLSSEHWSMQPVIDQLLHWSVKRIQDDTLIVADLTDISKYHARKLEGLGQVRDGSDRDKRISPGYMLFESYVRVDKWQLFPLVIEPLKTYAGAPTSENAEILQHILRIHELAEGKGIWVIDRGADRRELLTPLLDNGVAFIIRQRGDRHLLVEHDARLSVDAIADEMLQLDRPRRWPEAGVTLTRRVRLPDAADHELLLVAHWSRSDVSPLLLLVSPQARASGRSGPWFVKAYRRRWGVEDATRGIKQQFELERFLVRSWRSICRLIALMALAFYWLNLWGEERYATMREALMGHPWRIPKEVTYLFNWIATQIREILHPRPTGWNDTG